MICWENKPAILSYLPWSGNVLCRILYILFFSLFSFSRLSENLASPQTHFYTPDIPHYLAVVLMTAIQDEKFYLSYLLKYKRHSYWLISLTWTFMISREDDHFFPRPSPALVSYTFSLTICLGTVFHHLA